MRVGLIKYANMKTTLEMVAALVRECGVLIRDADRSRLTVDSKSGRANFVTQYDKLVQARLQSGLREIRADVEFVGEEGSDAAYAPVGAFWIVDPIDGTTNFIKNYHYSAISVALVVDGVAQLGVVYNPYANELFTAIRGEGAKLNGEKISVSSASLENGLVIFGTSPYDESLSQRSFELAYEYFKKAMDVRRSGSAALDLCAVAAGRAELFFELQLAPWDHAAGGLIVQEAGGVVSDAHGKALSYDCPCSVVARGIVADKGQSLIG